MAVLAHLLDFESEICQDSKFSLLSFLSEVLTEE
jgi:hypothetical protein